MSRKRLIERLKWYYPLERFHTYVTVPAILIYLLFKYPIQDIVFLCYGLIFCTIVLYQGQLYWKLKLDRLMGKEIDQGRYIGFFKKSRRSNWFRVLFMIPVFLVQLYFQNWDINTNDMLWWVLLANVFAILEHINYYYIQLMIDNQYDFEYLWVNKRLKRASLAKDLIENKI